MSRAGVRCAPAALLSPQQEPRSCSGIGCERPPHEDCPIGDIAEAMNRINVDAAIGATSTAVPTSGVRGNECASTRNVVGFELGQRIFAAKHLQVALTHPGVPRAIVFGAVAASLVAVIGVDRKSSV